MNDAGQPAGAGSDYALPATARDPTDFAGSSVPPRQSIAGIIAVALRGALMFIAGRLLAACNFSSGAARLRRQCRLRPVTRVSRCSA